MRDGYVLVTHDVVACFEAYDCKGLYAYSTETTQSMYFVDALRGGRVQVPEGVTVRSSFGALVEPWTTMSYLMLVDQSYSIFYRDALSFELHPSSATRNGFSIKRHVDDDVLSSRLQGMAIAATEEPASQPIIDRP